MPEPFKKPVTFRIPVKEGHLTWSPDQKVRLLNFIGKNAADYIYLTFDWRKPKRTNAQNRFYWFYLGIIADETGESPDTLHNLFKGEFLSEGITTVYGKPVRKTKSTTNLTKGEFVDYMIEISQLTGIPVPESDANEAVLLV